MICDGLDVLYYSVRPTLQQYLAKNSSIRPAVFLRGDPCHPNAKGHELISGDLLLTLESSGLLP